MTLGPQFSAYEQELMNAVQRRQQNPAPLGRGKSGLLGPLDADQADRTVSAGAEMDDFGFKIEPTDRVGRGFTVDTGIPNVSVIVGAHPERRGFQVSVVNHDRFASNEDGSYKYPEGWGDHSEHLDIDKEELPTALMDMLSRPEVRRHMYPPTS